MSAHTTKMVVAVARVRNYVGDVLGREQGGRTSFRRQTVVRHGGALVAVGATLTGLLAQVDVAPTPTIALLAAREVRTIDTAELGVPHPQGLAFLPEDGSLLVLGGDSAETTALRVTTAGDLTAISQGPTITNPATATFDPDIGAARAVGEGSLLSVSDQTATPVDLAELDLRDAQGAVVDGNGEWVVLDADTQSLVRAAVRGSSVEETGRTSLRPLGAEHLQGLARHPTTGRLYVAGSDEQLLFELDDRGVLQATYRLGDLDLRDLRSMTFAPSADTTDDPDRQHLFIADAGSRSAVGDVTEVALESGLTLVATEPTVTPQLVQVIHTSQFSPASPDPAGIVYLPGRDRMQVVDSEVDETTGAGYHGVNLWQLTRTGTVTDTGSTWTGGAGFSREPTGLGFDPGTNTLFVSDDSANRVWLDRPGPDGRFGTADDVLTYVNAGAYGSGDTEDPEFDPVTGHLFFADGANKEVYRVDPVNGVFGDGNDLMTQFDVERYGVRDPEGLALDPVRGTLLVGDRSERKIYEVTKAGDLVRIVDATGISGLRFVSGLAWGPASDGSGRISYWIADRAVDNGADANENDGKIFELRVDSGTIGSPPVAVADSAVTAANTPVTVDVAANDSDPDGNLDPASVTVTSPPANGTATPNGNGTVTYTPNTNVNGTDTFTYRICDTTSLCATATVTITITAVGDPPVAVADSAVTPEDTPVTINVAANDSDPDGNLAPSSVTVTSPPANGTATPNGNGTVTYTPNTNVNGTDTFTYRICDTTSLCATATVTITKAIPYHLSFTQSATLPGISGTVSDEDIVTYDPATGWAMFFDASDVGITASDLSDFHIRADGTVLMTFSDALDIPGLTSGPDGTRIDDSDVILFTPTSIGATTAGTFSFYLDGSDVGLDATSEDIDSLHELANGTLVISTNGNASVPGLKAADEDLLLLSLTATGAVSAGTFSHYFDGSDVGLTSGGDDLDAITFDRNGDLLFSTVGANSLGSTDEDINRFTGTFGPTTVGTRALELALAALGIASSNNLDGLALGS